MNKRTILVRKKKLICQTCDNEFFGYVEVPDEGFGYAAQLYECDQCHEIFSHSIEDTLYEGPPEEKIKGRSCPKCNAPFEKSLHRKKLIGNCPVCGDSNFQGTNESEETHIEAYQLYE